MKLKFALSMMVAVLFMTACSDDDNNEGTQNLAQNIAGTYKGYTIAELKHITIPTTTADEAITMTDNADGTANVAFESKQWGKFNISKAAITLTGDNYSIKGSGKTLMSMDANSVKEYDCKFEGILSKDKKTASFVFNAPAVKDGLKITFELGNAPANMLIANIYTGSLDLSVNGKPADKIEDSKVEIKSVKDGKVSITLAGFGTGHMKLEDIVIADVPVTDAKDGTYSLETKINTTSGNISVTGSLNGTIKNGKANITFVIKPGAMPMPVTAVFTSK